MNKHVEPHTRASCRYVHLTVLEVIMKNNVIEDECHYAQVRRQKEAGAASRKTRLPALSSPYDESGREMYLAFAVKTW
ncbi:hypothetical protein M407DRAFT_140910 [Tulasnella calospora MUT 4182]|uniref:Uncharacterized protein n=1 Tax=Tulasnella calospora MUT 4182 TaxID=1051891 RepID=A0A0C3Q7L7_9AGAM|nr:hypothetical protein M407DRAFT_140910 [Tulasnella calospora MUT 4182]